MKKQAQTFLRGLISREKTTMNEASALVLPFSEVFLQCYSNHQVKLHRQFAVDGVHFRPNYIEFPFYTFTI